MGIQKDPLINKKILDRKNQIDFFMAQRMYDINIQFLQSDHTLGHIPKTIHIINIGSQKITEQALTNISKLLQHHPQWKAIFWTDSDTKIAPFSQMEKQLLSKIDFGPFQEYINATKHIEEKALLTKYAILYKFGGLFMNPEFSPLRSLTPFAEKYDFVAAFEPFFHQKSLKHCLNPSSELLLVKPHHIILGETLKLIMARWHLAKIRYPGPNNTRRMMYRSYDTFTQAALSLQNRGVSRDLILPTAYFYSNTIFTRASVKKLRKSGHIYALYKNTSKGFSRHSYQRHFKHSFTKRKK
jgi:hypothetical protein